MDTLTLCRNDRKHRSEEIGLKWDLNLWPCKTVAVLERCIHTMPQVRCVAARHCTLLHRNCDVVALRCRIKVKFILTCNAACLEKIGNSGTWFLGNFDIWREFLKEYIKEMEGNWAILEGNFNWFPGKCALFPLRWLAAERKWYMGTPTQCYEWTLTHGAI